jgi:hypothetical protein
MIGHVSMDKISYRFSFGKGDIIEEDKDVLR